MKLLKGCAFYGPNNNKYSHTDENCENHVAVLTLFQSDSNIIFATLPTHCCHCHYKPEDLTSGTYSDQCYFLSESLISCNARLNWMFDRISVCCQQRFPVRPYWTECFCNAFVKLLSYPHTVSIIITNQWTSPMGHILFNATSCQKVLFPARADWTEWFWVKLFSILPYTVPVIVTNQWTSPIGRILVNANLSASVGWLSESLVSCKARLNWVILSKAVLNLTTHCSRYYYKPVDLSNWT